MKEQQSLRASAASNPDQINTQKALRRKISVVILFVSTVFLGLSNRALSRMAVVPMENYVFFLAQLMTFGYSIIYSMFLMLNYRQGRVTDAMLNINRKPFIVIGALEAMQLIFIYSATAKLPGMILPMLSQSILLWQMLVSVILLKKRYTSTQVLGVMGIIGGVIIAAWPRGSGLLSVDLTWAAVFVVSLLFPSIGSVVKEKVFTDFKEQNGGKQLNVFVVNTFGSISQAFFVLLSLPLMAHLRGVSFWKLPEYAAQGLTCLMGGTPTCGADCTSAPLLTGLYIAVNIGFNIYVLKLLRTIGAVWIGIMSACMVPLGMYLFSLNLPVLGKSPAPGANVLIGCATLMLGMLCFNFNAIISQKWSAKPKGKAE